MLKSLVCLFKVIIKDGFISQQGECGDDVGIKDLLNMHGKLAFFNDKIVIGSISLRIVHVQTCIGTDIKCNIIMENRLCQWCRRGIRPSTFAARGGVEFVALTESLFGLFYAPPLRKRRDILLCTCRSVGTSLEKPYAYILHPIH